MLVYYKKKNQDLSCDNKRLVLDNARKNNIMIQQKKKQYWVAMCVEEWHLLTMFIIVLIALGYFSISLFPLLFVSTLK